MSDIHGKYNLFLKMLDKIKFSEKDELYIIGDIIDRGENSLEMIDYVMTHKNIHLIMGNHEYMLLESSYFDFHTIVPETRLWFRNGGDKTFFQLRECSKEKVDKIVDFLSKLPIKVELSVNNKVFLLCHGSYSKYDIKEDILWERTLANTKPILGKILIFGHTGTYHYQDDIPYKIWKNDSQTLINVDCGLARNSKASQLGCLRLDDMKEFYIRNIVK